MNTPEPPTAEPLAPLTGSAITVEELKVICDATVRLVEIRQRGCAHLCVENIAPEIMHKLLTRLRMHKSGLECVTGFERFEEHWPNVKVEARDQ